ISPGHSINNWGLDSGATASATHDENDCTVIQPCDVTITAAGCTFKVDRIGTAHINARDARGRSQKLKISRCLISPLFPYKLLSLQMFTKKGHPVSMEGDTIHISNKHNDIVLEGKRDPDSQ